MTNATKLQAFLDLAGKVISPKTPKQYGIMKNDKQLLSTNKKEWLFMDYESNDSAGFYNFSLSKAFSRLTAKNDIPTQSDIYLDANNLIALLNKSEMQEVNEAEAKSLLDAYKFISDDETRYQIQGIYFDDGFIVATDGRRLYCNNVSSGCTGKIVPQTKTILTVLKQGSNIKISSTGEWIVFSFDYKGFEFSYFVKEIAGQFPSWRKVMPENQKYRMDVPALNAWKEAYKILKAIKFGDSNRIFITRKPNTNTVSIIASGMDIATIEWKSFPDDTLAINFEYLNSAIMLDGLEYITYTDFTRALTFYCANGAKVLVMPMVIE